MWQGRVNRYRRGEIGQSLAEFALVLLVLMMIVLGIIDFTRAIYAHSAVANAAREGARYALIHPGDTAEIKRAAAALAVGLDNVKVDVRRPAEDIVEVVVSHRFQPVSFLIARYVDGGSGAGLELRARSRMYVE